MTITETISARILHRVANGMTLEAAIDAVLGAGQYDALVADLYRLPPQGGLSNAAQEAVLLE